MLNKSATLLLLIVLIPMMVFAQTKRDVKVKQPIKVVESTVLSSNLGHGSVADANYVAVDTMANGFGPAIGILNPMSYDPYSGAVALVHRGKTGYAAGSGAIWYNMSTDFGATWMRVAGVNESAAQKFGRYPSMYISNPTHGPLASTTGLFSWPELVPAGAGFGGIGYGADQPLGAGTPFAEIINITATPPLYSSQVPCWAGDTSPYLFWVSDNSTDNSVDLFRTTDFSSVEKIQPGEWNDTVWSGNICIGGVGFQNTQYVGFLGSFTEVTIPGGWSFGYSKSTDNGSTWSRNKVVDWRTIPALSAYDHLFDATKGDAFVTYQGDLQVDKNGRVHFIMALTDTISGETGNNAICEIFEKADGNWDGYVIATGISDTLFTGATSPGLGQSGACAFLAVDSTRNVLAAQWCNTGAGGWGDIYISYRALDETAWSAPVNITNSANTNNNLAHFAPFMKKNGNDYTVFSMYNYPADGSLPGDPNLANNVIYAAPYTFTKVTGITDAISTVNNYSLSQNYPNPFNPSTSISFSVAERGNVSLKVFDVLGKEVATLVNGEKEQGSYSVNFDASKLASGLYIYTLKAGNTSISKKMMLMK